MSEENRIPSSGLVKAAGSRSPFSPHVQGRCPQDSQHPAVEQGCPSEVFCLCLQKLLTLRPTGLVVLILIIRSLKNPQ